MWERARISGSGSRRCTASGTGTVLLRCSALMPSTLTLPVDTKGARPSEPVRARGRPLPEISFPPSLLIEEGDHVVAEYVFRAMFTEPLTMPDGTVVPATGDAHEIPCVTISEVRAGKFVGMRDYFDLVVGLTQLGLM